MLFYKISASGLFLQYSYNLANFSYSKYFLKEMESVESSILLCPFEVSIGRDLFSFTFL